MTDELRRQLAALDPARGVTIDPVTSDRARTLVEATMSTPLLPVDTPDAPVSHLSGGRRPARRWSFLAGAFGLAAVAVVAVVAVTNDDEAPASPPMALTIESVDPSMSMCLPVDAATIAGADVAFSGTVTSVADGVVTLDVDHWYHGGDAAAVTIAVPEGFSPALDGVEFVPSSRYFVTALDGQVLGCGLSGPASPELEQLFAEAFGA
jgi:hypothetical protein